MQEYEISIIVDNLQFNNKESWEQTRFIAFANIQKSTKKKLSPQDILKFPWEKEEDKKDIEISDVDIKRLEKKSQMISKLINANGK